MQKTSIKKISWKFGEPATWGGVYARNEVPFACMCCRKQTATHRVELTENGHDIKIVACETCAILPPEKIHYALSKRKTS